MLTLLCNLDVNGKLPTSRFASIKSAAVAEQKRSSETNKNLAHILAVYVDVYAFSFADAVEQNFRRKAGMTGYQSKRERES